jgi:hypothetical protein
MGARADFLHQIRFFLELSIFSWIPQFQVLIGTRSLPLRCRDFLKSNGKKGQRYAFPGGAAVRLDRISKSLIYAMK